MESYYKIYLLQMNHQFTVLELYGNEYEYKQDHFMCDDDGNEITFDSEKEAVDWMIKNLKEEFIDPDYLNSVKFNRNRFLK